MTNTKVIEEWLLSQYGLKLQNNQLPTVSSTLNGLKETLDIKSDEKLNALIKMNDERIVNPIIEKVTIHESYFFRDQSLFNMLEDIILPTMIDKKRKTGNLNLKIWSAGCADGEEIYSIAMLLDKLIPDSHMWNITLLGTDISELALEKARNGKYTKISLRSTPKEIEDIYFVNNDHFYDLSEKIKKMAKFQKHNLCDQCYPSETFDIILCRNVFIYFTVEAIRHCLKRFDQHLDDDGYLFLGASDFATYLEHDLEFKMTNGVSYFRRKIQKEPEKVKETPEPRVPYIQRAAEQGILLNEIKTLYESGDYPDALKLIDSHIKKFGKTSLAMEYKIKSLFGLGDTETAHDLCVKSLKYNSNNEEILFIKGMIEMELGRLSDAEASLKKAVTVKDNFPEAHFHLGMLLLRNLDKHEGIKQLKKALTTARLSDKEKKILGSPNMSMDDFINSIESTIHYHREQ